MHQVEEWIDATFAVRLHVQSSILLIYNDSYIYMYFLYWLPNCWSTSSHHFSCIGFSWYSVHFVPVSCIFNMNFPLEVNSWGYFASPSCCVARCIKTTHVGLHGFLGFLFNVGSNEMRWQRWHLFVGFGGGHGAVSYLLHSCLKIWFWDVLRLAKHNPFSSRHSKNEVCFSPCQLRQLARVARCWIVIGKERASSLLRGSGWPDDSHLSWEPTSCFKRMDPSQSTAKVLFKGVWFEWFDWFCFTPYVVIFRMLSAAANLPVRLHGSWFGNCPSGGGNCNNWFQRDFWILRFDQPRMNQVQFLARCHRCLIRCL